MALALFATTLDIRITEPPRDFAAWDHVVECSLSVQSSRIVIAGCTDYFPDASRIDISPGMYRVRVSFSGLDSVSTDGLAGNDRYRIELWQSPPIDPLVLKERAV